MPDKQNDSKLMAMLERKGIVRKADSEDDVPDSGSGTTQSRPDADIRAMFGSSPSENTNVTPAARQPVPGISTPVLPGERQQGAVRDQTVREQPRPMESRVIDIPKAESIPVQEEPEAEEEVSGFEETAIVEQPRPVVAPVQASPPIDLSPYKPEPFRAEPPAVKEEYAVSSDNQQRSPEEYTGNYLDIDDLYEALSLKSKKTDTIYLIEDYLLSLPDSLPDESRREIVGRIVAASGFDYDLLMGDGVLRVKMLKEYAERFARHTDDYVAARQAELDELDRQMSGIRLMIENRRELHKKQFFTIEAEAQRLKEILTFISG